MAANLQFRVDLIIGAWYCNPYLHMLCVTLVVTFTMTKNGHLQMKPYQAVVEVVQQAVLRKAVAVHLSASVSVPSSI